MSRRLLVACAVLAIVGGSTPAAFAAAPPASWDGLSQVKSKRVQHAYLLPGADFSAYTKVMLDPTEVAFQKNWLRDYNSQTMTLSGRITEADANKMLEKVRTGFEEIFAKAYADAGYQVVTEAGPDVLRVRTAVANLFVSSPDRQTSGRSRSYAQEAGGATLVLEVRDSTSGALLGRAVDSKIAGDTGAFLRNSVTNRSDFRQLFSQWAKKSVEALAALKAQSPIAVPTQTAKK